MNLSDLRDRLRRKADDIRQYLEGDAKHIVGQTAVDHFRKSFDDQGYTDEPLNPWQEVERRKPESPWYGHSGETGRYSPERTKAPILTGETGELQEAIRYAPIPGGVRVSDEKPYGHIHNYGGPTKVYGKTPFVMPRRQFMGPSKALTRQLKERITRDLTRILKDQD